jgi:hypothetical protein
MKISFVCMLLVGFLAALSATKKHERSNPVFVLHRAEVGDYEFLGLFSSREDGEKVADEYRMWHPDRTYKEKPYPIDYCKGFVLGPTYAVHVRLKSGELERWGVEADVRDPVNVVACKWGNDSIEVVSPTSHEHAEHAAVVARQKWINHEEIR